MKKRKTKPKCPRCDGTGKEPDHKLSPCIICNGYSPRSSK
jgi:hypothetical protein